jgi:hypothetical protein
VSNPQPGGSGPCIYVFQWQGGPLYFPRHRIDSPRYGVCVAIYSYLQKICNYWVFRFFFLSFFLFFYHGHVKYEAGVLTIQLHCSIIKIRFSIYFWKEIPEESCCIWRSVAALPGILEYLHLALLTVAWGSLFIQVTGFLCLQRGVCVCARVYLRVCTCLTECFNISISRIMMMMIVIIILHITLRI